mgnify:FL=1
MTAGKGKCMKVHSLLKSLNAIDEEMIAEADRFAVKRREQLKSRQHIFVTEVTAVAAIAIAVAGVFFLLVAARSHTTKAVRSKWSSAG